MWQARLVLNRCYTSDGVLRLCGGIVACGAAFAQSPRQEATLMTTQSAAPLPEIVDLEAVRSVQAHPIDAELTIQVAEIFKALADPTACAHPHALARRALCWRSCRRAGHERVGVVSHQLRLLRGLRGARAPRGQAGVLCAGRRACDAAVPAEPGASWTLIKRKM